MGRKKKTNINIEIPQGIIRYTNMLRAFLGADPCITVGYNEKTEDVEITVTGCQRKAECLDAILLDEIDSSSKYCTEPHRILVNSKRHTWKKTITAEMITAAFAGNPYFKGIEKFKMPEEWGGMTRTFAMLSPVVVQTPNDNFGNPYGLDTFLAQDFIHNILNSKARDVVAWTTDRK